MQQIPFQRRQKQNTDIWKGPSFKDNSFEEERCSHIYKKQHRRKSCYCSQCGKMSLFQYTYMNVSTCVNYIKNSLIAQQDMEKQQELDEIIKQNKERQFRNNIHLSFSYRNTSYGNLQQILNASELKNKNRKSCDCSECGTKSNFQLKHQKLQLIKKQSQSHQFRIKKVIKRHQYRKQHTEQFSPVKNGEFRYLKKRMIELDLNNSKNDAHILKKFQLRQSQTNKILHHQLSLNLFETYTARTKTDILSPLSNRKTLLPYLQFTQNRSPPQKPIKKPITNQQREYFKKHNMKSGIF